MWALILSFGMVAIPPQVGDGLVAVPVDVEIGRQVIELRQPLIARTRGTKLLLFVRDRGDLGIDKNNMISDFKSSVPEGSVQAFLSGSNGEQLALSHSGYQFFRGYMGLVLTEIEAGQRGSFYHHLELESKIPLKDVRLVWLDRQGRRVEDTEPLL